MRSYQKIATIYTDFPQKFGIPRQSGLAPMLRGRVVMEAEFSIPEAFRGLDEFSHIWLIWEFSENIREEWSPTVRPPRLGGNVRMGVFSTRSPFRPNPIGLSCVQLERIDCQAKEGITLHVCGADLLDGTPIIDIKPYIPYADSYPEASGGFAERERGRALVVECDEKWRRMLPDDKWEALMEILCQDPRPSYQNDPERVYGMAFAGVDIHFQVRGERLIIRDVETAKNGK